MSQTGREQRTKRATIVVFAFLVIYWLVLFYGTHMKLPTGILPGNSDKLIHFICYAGLGVLLLTLRATRGPFQWRSVYSRWYILAGYGVFDEVTQLLVNRTADPADWVADILGSAVGLGLVTFLVWIIGRK